MKRRRAWVVSYAALIGVAVAFGCRGESSRGNESGDRGGARGPGGASNGGVSGTTTNGGTSGNGASAGESGESSGGTSDGGGRGGATGVAGQSGGRAGAGSGGTPSGGRAGAGGTPMNGGAGGVAGAAGSGAVAGSGGTVTTGPFACTYPVPANCGQINDFPSAAPAVWGSGDFTGGFRVIGRDIRREAPMDAFHVVGIVQGYGRAFTIWFSRCSTLEAHSGITFTLSGTTASTMQTNTIAFQVQTNANYPWQLRPHERKGGCTAPSMTDPESVCLSPTVNVVLSTTPQTITWAQMTGGSPTPWNASLGPAELVGLQWQFPWAEGYQPYAVDVTLDDVRFTGGVGPTTMCPTSNFGTRPCAGLCSTPTTLSLPFESGPLGTAASCFERSGTIGAFQCYDFTPPRTFRMNDVPYSCGTLFSNPPTPINTGYCFQVSPGEPASASFRVF